MNERRPISPDTILSEPDATQLLARASELDAALRGGASIATLRAAAAEAGISSGAFEAALAEAQVHSQTQRTTATQRRSRLWSLAAGAALLMLGTLTIAVTRSVTPANMIERSLEVRCLATEDAAELIRPYLEPGMTVVVPPTSHFLRVRATRERINRIQSVLDEAERSARSCQSR